MTDKIEFHEHPEYSAKLPELEKYRVLYDGKHEELISPTYLWPHELEGSNEAAWTDPVTGIVVKVGEKLRAVRANRSRYLNLFEPIVSNWTSLLFQKPIEFDDATKTMLGDETEDITGDGTSLEDFIKNQIAVAYFRDGQPNVFVDAPKGEFANLGEQQKAGFRPYMSLLDVLAVKDWQIQASGPAKGKYEWLRYEFKEIGKRSSPTDAPKMEDYCKVLSSANGVYTITVYRKDGENGNWSVVEEIPVKGNWASAPVATILNNEPWVKDIADPQLILFNIMSAWYNLLNTQAFQRIFIAGNLGEKHRISISEYAVSQVPEGAAVTVISPSDTTALTTAADQTIDQMYRVAFNRTRGLSGNSREAPSAETIREMNEELIALLRTALGQIETLVNQALAYYARFKGQNDFKGKVTLDKDLTVEDLQSEIETFATYRTDIVKNLPWHKAHLRKVVTRMRYSDEDTDEILDEIDAMKKDEPIDPMKALQPFLGNTNGGRPKPTQQQAEEAEAGAEAEDRPKRE